MKNIIKDHLEKEYGFTKKELGNADFEPVLIYIESFHASELAKTLGVLTSPEFKALENDAKLKEFTKNDLLISNLAYAEHYYSTAVLDKLKAFEAREKRIGEKEKEIAALNKSLNAHIVEYANKNKPANLNKQVDRRITEIVKDKLGNTEIDELLKFDRGDKLSRAAKTFGVRWVRDKLRVILLG